MTASRTDLIETFLTICRRVESKGFVSATDGNISTRLPNGSILATPSGMNKGMVGVDDLVELSPDGTLLAGSRKPSTEIDMHLFIYQQRPDIDAVVHCHPVYATAFAVAHLPLIDCVFPEVIVGLGAIPLAPYATPSTEEVSRSISSLVRSATAILLANHGVVTYGKDLWDAYYKMEKVEQTAHIVFIARLLGGEKKLSAGDIEKLRAVSQRSYGKDFSGLIACATAEEVAVPDLTEDERRFVIEEVKRRLHKASGSAAS